MLPVRRRIWEDLADAPPAELQLVHRAGDELIFVLAPRS